MNRLISELIEYGKVNGLIDEADEVYTVNRLLELFGQQDFEAAEITSVRPLNQILEDFIAEAEKRGILQEPSITEKDLFDTRVMGLLTPQPSIVRAVFKDRYNRSAKEATDYYYGFSKATNYIRTDRIAKDEKWVTDTEYGPIDITINLSKPEKDPRDIAKAGQAKKSGYPACLLCRENEGYCGHISHPARQNHRIVPMQLCGENYYLQYSPYVYYNEHCIIFNEKHIPMKIDRAVFDKLLSFVEQFPHYIAGSNADLPIVGGSILSHDHFQGGGYEFSMAKAPVERSFQVKGFEDVSAGIVKWPMSVIRLSGSSRERVAALAEIVLNKWRGYTDEAAFIFAETEGVPHNTITPIARMRDGSYELDLVLRNNITTEEKPWGVYHPTEDLHHIKKENIGLIEVMGLAILPARLKKEIAVMKKLILEGRPLTEDESTAKHAEWADSWLGDYDINEGNIDGIIKDEISKVFVKVLECAGVYKRNEEGQRAFDRFAESLNE